VKDRNPLFFQAISIERTVKMIGGMIGTRAPRNARPVVSCDQASGRTRERNEPTNSRNCNGFVDEQKVRSSSDPLSST